MEKISAACAMDWCIELDKGLRSRKPGAAVEAVRRIGPRLEQWGREPEYTMAVYSMFGLIPGEDRLFASAIFLKLVEAFRVGDKGVRRAVVELFLSEFKKRRKRRGKEGICCIFSKCTEENCLELLRKVKDVFDKVVDVESRADCLVLFGCWAVFCAENADVRHLVLASIGSVHDVEVNAALFAAGCFCEQSDDFAYVVLHILVNLVASTKTSFNVKSAGIRILGKFQSSYVITQKAYEAALTLMRSLTDEDLLGVLLMTLSELASQSTLIVPEQVNLLCSFLNQETTLHTKAAALRSLNFIYNSSCYFHVSAHVVESLLGLLRDPQVQDSLQSAALYILQKRSLTISLMDMTDFSELLETLQSVCQSQSGINKVLALNIMASAACKISKDIEDESSNVSLISYIMSLIIEQTTILALQRVDYNSQIDSHKEQEGLSLFKILICLVRKHPNHCMFVVDKICLLIERMEHEGETIMYASQPGLPVLDITVSNATQIKSVRFKLLQGSCRVLSASLDVLFEVGDVSTEIIGKVVSTLRLACQISHRICPSMLDSLPLRPYIHWTTHLDKTNCLLDKKAVWGECFSEIEIVALECSKNMLSVQDYWPAYRFGVCAGYQGIYTVLIFIFEHLMTKVRTGIYFCWLKSVVEFAYSEWGAVRFCYSKPRSGLENCTTAKIFVIEHPWHNTGQVTKDDFLKTGLSGCSRKLLHSLSNICSARKTLESGVTTCEGFYFQRWFLALKIKLNEAVLEFLRLIGSHVTSQESAGYKEHVEHGSQVKCTISGKSVVPWSCSVSRLSSRLKSLSFDFDLMLTSFVDLDLKSMSVISALALSSSVLAFCAEYVLLSSKKFPCETAYSVRMDNMSDSTVVHNLLIRVLHIDEETSKNIRELLKSVRPHIGCFHLPSRTQMLPSFVTKELISICNQAMTGVANLQNEFTVVSQNDNPSKNDKARVELLSDIISRWLDISFHIPKSFFHCRPLVGSKLYVLNADPRKPDCLSTVVGSCLALNICIELKNFPSKKLASIKKLFCILQCRPSFRVNDLLRRHNESALPAWEKDYLIDLNQKLLHHVSQCKVTGRNCQEMSDKGSMYTYTSLELNEKHQGFSTSMLDVSSFPAGTYETRWHSCFVDDRSSYWSMLPLNAGPFFTIHTNAHIQCASERN